MVCFPERDYELEWSIPAAQSVPQAEAVQSICRICDASRPLLGTNRENPEETLKFRIFRVKTNVSFGHDGVESQLPVGLFGLSTLIHVQKRTPFVVRPSHIEFAWVLLAESSLFIQ